jgi:hypothetical protein
MHNTHGGGSWLGQVVPSLFCKHGIIQVDLTNLPKGQKITMSFWYWTSQVVDLLIIFLSVTRILLLCSTEKIDENKQVFFSFQNYSSC